MGLGLLALLPLDCIYYAVPIAVLLGLYPFAFRQESVQLPSSRSWLPCIMGNLHGYVGCER